MLVLGIESTCDETGCAVVRDGKEILSNIVSTQIDLHNTFGGVVPELACRRHVDVIIPVLRESLEKANVTLDEIDLIAIAHGPGLIGALLVGLNTAKGLALALDTPLVGVNHVEAHLYASIMSQDSVAFPCLGVVISGGHTALVKMHDVGRYELIGTTVDDAIGEAFDKVAKMLGLPYPGGPAIESLALSGDASRYPFKAGTVKGHPLHFSFSGLKTRVLYQIKGQNRDKDAPLCIEESDKADVAASFQQAALSDIVSKSKKALTQYGCRSIILGGGVANNQRLRKMFAEAMPETDIHWPASELTLDNAAMIAGLGYHSHARLGPDSLDLEAKTRIPLANLTQS